MIPKNDATKNQPQIVVELLRHPSEATQSGNLTELWKITTLSKSSSIPLRKMDGLYPQLD